jgi:hypothetical protein
MYIGQVFEKLQRKQKLLGYFFQGTYKPCINFEKQWVWLHFWVILSQTSLVALRLALRLAYKNLLGSDNVFGNYCRLFATREMKGIMRNNQSNEKWNNWNLVVTQRNKERTNCRCDHEPILRLLNLQLQRQRFSM